MVVALGIAFRTAPVQKVSVDVAAQPGAEGQGRSASVTDPKVLEFVVQINDGDTAHRRLRSGKTDLIVIASGDAGFQYRLDKAGPRAGSPGPPCRRRCSARREGKTLCRRCPTKR
jgi:hypothetical protein